MTVFQQKQVRKKRNCPVLNNCHGHFSINEFELHLNAEVPYVTDMEMWFI